MTNWAKHPGHTFWAQVGIWRSSGKGIAGCLGSAGSLRYRNEPMEYGQHIEAPNLLLKPEISKLSTALYISLFVSGVFVSRPPPLNPNKRPNYHHGMDRYQRSRATRAAVHPQCLRQWNITTDNKDGTQLGCLGLGLLGSL